MRQAVNGRTGGAVAGGTCSAITRTLAASGTAGARRSPIRADRRRGRSWLAARTASRPCSSSYFRPAARFRLGNPPPVARRGARRLARDEPLAEVRRQLLADRLDVRRGRRPPSRIVGLEGHLMVPESRGPAEDPWAAMDRAVVELGVRLPGRLSVTDAAPLRRPSRRPRRRTRAYVTSPPRLGSIPSPASPSRRVRPSCSDQCTERRAAAALDSRSAGRGTGRARGRLFCGNPRLIPPWLGSSQRVVTTLPRVKKCTPSMPWAWVSRTASSSSHRRSSTPSGPAPAR